MSKINKCDSCGNETRINCVENPAIVEKDEWRLEIKARHTAISEYECVLCRDCLRRLLEVGLYRSQYQGV